MRSIYRLGIRLANGLELVPNHARFLPISSKSSNLGRIVRNYSLPAKESEEEDDELEMIDQRKLPTEHRSPPGKRVFRLVDEIAGLTVVEIAEMSSVLMKKMNMKEGPTIAVMKAGSAGVAMKPTVGAVKEEKKPEKTVFELKLEAYDAAAKIKIIKDVTTFTDLGLKEAKELVEKTPVVIKKESQRRKGNRLLRS